MVDRDKTARAAPITGLRPAIDASATCASDGDDKSQAAESINDRSCGLKRDSLGHVLIMCDNRTFASSVECAKIAHTTSNRRIILPPMDSDELMFQRWVAKGLKKPGKDQHGLAAALSLDRSAISKIVTGKRLLKAHEIEKVAAYIEEAPPERVMQVMFEIGGGQEVIPIEGDGPIEHVSVAGFYGVEADLAIVRGDSMWPLIPSGGRVFIGPGRNPSSSDNRQMRAVTLDDGRAFIKVMRRMADPLRWTLESFNAPPIEDVIVVKVGEILRIEP